VETPKITATFRQNFVTAEARYLCNQWPRKPFTLNAPQVTSQRYNCRWFVFVLLQRICGTCRPKLDARDKCSIPRIKLWSASE